MDTVIILGIETSCDETAAAIVIDGTQILAHNIASSLSIQNQYGGVVPEVAARHQTEYMIPILKSTFEQAQIKPDDIDAIAVTIGPGLMGPLLVGVETAKTLSYVWQKPLIPINHMIGHIHSAWLDEDAPAPPKFPLLALIASGGHTDLILMNSHTKLTPIGSTRDDAVGEAFDKVARILNLGYPGGPIVEKRADEGNPNAYSFPRPMIDSDDFNFSYSGLKTAVLYKIKEIIELRGELDERLTNDICASFRSAAFEVLVRKSIKAAQTYNVKSVLVTGGVAASRHLKALMQKAVADNLPAEVSLNVPPLKLATDNATYIAGAGYFLFDKLALNPQKDFESILSLEPNPNLTSTEI